MIKYHIEQAIANVEAEKRQELEKATERVTREKILPYNAKVEQQQLSEIDDLTASFNKAVKDLQDKYSARKTAIIEKFDTDKKTYASACISSEKAVVAAKYDKTLTELKKMLADTKE